MARFELGLLLLALLALMSAPTVAQDENNPIRIIGRVGSDKPDPPFDFLIKLNHTLSMKWEIPKFNSFGDLLYHNIDENYKAWATPRHEAAYPKLIQKDYMKKYRDARNRYREEYRVNLVLNGQKSGWWAQNQKQARSVVVQTVITFFSGVPIEVLEDVNLNGGLENWRQLPPIFDPTRVYDYYRHSLPHLTDVLPPAPRTG